MKTTTDCFIVPSLLSPVTANFFLGNFEENALGRAAYRSCASSVMWMTYLQTGPMDLKNL
jgi:hypothetical protein